MSSSHSGTIGRKRVGSGSAAGSEYYYASGGLGGLGGSVNGGGTGGGEQLRRQRSAEWHSHGRHGHGHGHGLGHGLGHAMGHGYGSSSEDEYQNTGQSTAFDTQLLAQLLLQSQQLASMEHYNSDCEPDYLRQRDRHQEDTPLADGPPTVATAPEVTYAQPHQQRSTVAGSPLKVSTVSAGKYQSNANLGLFPNSSSSGGSSVQNGVTVHTPRSTNPFLNGSTNSGGESEEPPPEPAPPEIPPRTQSLLMSLRKHSDYKLKYEEKGDQKHEEFIPTSQLQKGEFSSKRPKAAGAHLNIT
ncbi:uncharacterized protein LOC113564500 [Drosophila erecta]|uniref:uncharacterized protein LOC113564500 n=1 Tax=Drosophila erecta TaxID=7220 RepID=UPI000F062983|nr:uncharacterized protein LOC113564500 [Drosophila erecta]